MSPLCKLHAVRPLDLGLHRSSLPAKTRTEGGARPPSTRTARARHQAGASPCPALDRREFGGVLAVIENATLPSSED